MTTNQYNPIAFDGIDKPANIHTFLDPALITKQHLGGAANYRHSVRSAVRLLWYGYTDLFGFVDNMYSVIKLGFTRAWHDGMAECGLKPYDMTQEEIEKLNYEMNTEATFVLGFGIDIMNNSKLLGGKLTPLLSRAEMWANKYEYIRSIAMQMACKDEKLLWRINPAKEHCGSCVRLNGRVYRASIWRKYDIYPRMHRLECGGWRCGCSLEKTMLPVTPGRPPMI
jgi:hypothetical protein